MADPPGRSVADTIQCIQSPRYAAVSIYPNIVTPPYISPVKQQIITGAPSSPRPIILIRKKLAGDTNPQQSQNQIGQQEANQRQSQCQPTSQSLQTSPQSSTGLSNVYITSHITSGGASKTTATTLTCSNVITSSVAQTSLPTITLSSPCSPLTATASAVALSSAPGSSLSPISSASLPVTSSTSVIHHSHLYNDISKTTASGKDRVDVTASSSVGITDLSCSEKIGGGDHENAANSNLKNTNSQNQPSTPNSDASGATPRKKPRKQLLEPFHLTTSRNMKLLSSNHDFKNDPDDRDGMMLLNSSPPLSNNYNTSSKDINSSPDLGVSSSATTSSLHKKPRPSILTSYNIPWKSLQYHFLRYSDVKQKPEKKLTLSELSNEGLQKKNGWKVQHLVTHIEDTDEKETEVFRRLRAFTEKFEKSDESLHKDINLLGVTYLSSSRNHFDTQVQLYDKLNDLIRGNLQRSKLFQDQIHEAKQLLIKLTNDHKERVGRLTKKCANKRTYINK